MSTVYICSPRKLIQIQHFEVRSYAIKREKWEFTFNLNNIFDSEYYETNLVRMPGRNLAVGLNINI